MASEKITALIEEVKGLTVLELSELVHALEEEFGVSAAAMAAPAAGGAAAPAAEEKTEFDVVLAEVGAEKIKVIKAPATYTQARISVRLKPPAVRSIISPAAEIPSRPASSAASPTVISPSRTVPCSGAVTVILEISRGAHTEKHRINMSRAPLTLNIF